MSELPESIFDSSPASPEPERPRRSRVSILNVLSVIMLVATLLTLCCYLTIIINPRLPVNPFPPATLLPTLPPFPTATDTPTPTPYIPPTWTPTPRPTDTPVPTPRPLAYWSIEEFTTGYPIEKIEVAGTYEQIGYAFGQWYRDHHFSARRLDDDEQAEASAALALYGDVHPGTVEQMRGVYDAYDLNLDDTSHGIPVWKSWWRFLLPGLVEDPACSVAFVRPEMASDGHARLGRNNDWAVSMPDTTLLFTYPEDAYANVVMTVGAPNFTVFDGMNDQGLALGIAAVDGAGYEPPEMSLVDIHVYRIALETCSNVSETIDFLSTVPLAFSPEFGTHVLLADASGASAVVEFLPEGVIVSRTETPYQVMTNDHWAGPASQFDDSRYQTAVAMLEEGQGEIDTEGLIAVMTSVHVYTQWTIVYDLEDQTLTLALPNDSFGARYTFSLAEFAARMERHE